MNQNNSHYLTKALECLAGAVNEHQNLRYNNAANRCYYAVFHAAIHALQMAGIEARGDDWGHEYVAAQFNGELIGRRHLYSRELRDVLRLARQLRETADYSETSVPRVRLQRILRRVSEFVVTIQRES